MYEDEEDAASVNTGATKAYADICTLGLSTTFADLRAFGLIGFQDAPNGLWLGRHGLSKKDVAPEIVMAAFRNKVDLVGLTSEDDKMYRGSPEDRFGYFREKALETLPKRLIPTVFDRNLVRIYDEVLERNLLFLNAETVHAPKGMNWGFKVHVVGTNMLEKRLTNPADLIYHAKHDHGNPLVFLKDLTLDSKTLTGRYPDLLSMVDGFITHDATSFKFRTKNAQKILSEYGDIKEIAVSSAHWPHELGRAGIGISREHVDADKVTGTEDVLKGLRGALTSSEHYTLIQEYNHPLRVAYLGALMKMYGGRDDRFKGDVESSYNVKNLKSEPFRFSS